MDSSAPNVDVLGYQLPALLRVLVIELNLAAMTLPMVPRTTMTTTAIRTRIRAYSTMLCPRW